MIERLSFLLNPPDPDVVGSSEYRAICECLEDGLASQDADDPEGSPTDLVEAMLDAFISHAEALKKLVEDSRR